MVCTNLNALATATAIAIIVLGTIFQVPKGHHLHDGRTVVSKWSTLPRMLGASS